MSRLALTPEERAKLIERGIITMPAANPEIYKPSPMVKQMLCGIKRPRCRRRTDLEQKADDPYPLPKDPYGDAK